MKIRTPNWCCTDNTWFFEYFYGCLGFVVWEISGHFGVVYQSRYCASDSAFSFPFVYVMYLNIASYLYGKQMKSKVGNKLYLRMIFICVRLIWLDLHDCPTMTPKKNLKKPCPKQVYSSRFFMILSFWLWVLICLVCLDNLSCSLNLLIRMVASDLYRTKNMELTEYSNHERPDLSLVALTTHAPFKGTGAEGSTDPSCLCIVSRPSVRVLHFKLFLKNSLMDFDEISNGCRTYSFLQVLLFFRQIHQRMDPKEAK